MTLQPPRATITAALVLLAGCAVPDAAETPSLNGTAWVLSSLTGRPAAPGAAPTARFDAGRIDGTDGCNRYAAPVRASAGAIEIGPRGASTQMACPPERMKLAEAFTAALAAATSYRGNGSQLQLLAADGSVLATFAAQSSTLAGTAWRATAINNGKQAVVSLVTGTQVTVEFGKDGSVSGTAGCNRYTSTWQAEGGNLRFTAPASTRMACGAAGVMEQEQAFLRALQTVAKTQFEGDRLDLRTADDALAVALTRAP